MMLRRPLAIVFLTLSGCAAWPTSQRQAEQPAELESTATVSLSHTGQYDEPRDPPPPINIIFQVEVYLVSVPFGTLSSNEAFFRRINEQCVDVATYDLLYRNGIRIGEAPLSELSNFRQYLSDLAPAQKITVTGIEVKNVEVPMKKDLPEQVIFYFDPANRLIGSSYDRSDNLMTIAFEPTPRKPGYLRLTLCPVVRAQRKVLQFGPRNDPREMSFVNPERFYDLNMRVDIPRDSFLIVTASEDARRPTSIGRAFLTIDAPAQRMEQVLLVIPKPFVP